MKSKLKAPGCLEISARDLTFEHMLSRFAFNVNLRRYTKDGECITCPKCPGAIDTRTPAGGY
jgi:hypothetical protein